jgi:glutathione S-transferase
VTYTLYWAPNTCSLSPHIVLREAALPFQLVRVDLRAKKLADGGDWLAINPKGYVPALRLPTGEVLTEGAVMVQYLADQAPDKQLSPPVGTMARVRLSEWLHFIATELHKGMSPLYNPLAGDDFKKSLKENRLLGRWTTLAEGIGDKPFLTDTFTIADAYAFYVLRAWQHAQKEPLDRWPVLRAYYERLAARPAVAAALEAEGAKP